MTASKKEAYCGQPGEKSEEFVKTYLSFAILSLVCILSINGCSSLVSPHNIDIINIKVGTGRNIDNSITGEAASFSNISSLEVQASFSGGWHDDPPYINLYHDNVFYEQYRLGNGGSSNLLFGIILSKTSPANFPIGNYRGDIISEAGIKKGEFRFTIT